MSPPATVPSLVEADGLLLTSADAPRLTAQARIEDVERELRAQIDVVARSGLGPTHLDRHVVADGGRRDVLDLTLALAREHGLAARVRLEPARRDVRGRGLPVVDHDVVDSSAPDVEGTAQRYAQMLHELPAGLSERALHPAVGGGTPAEEEGVLLISYRDLHRCPGGRARGPAGTGPLDLSPSRRSAPRPTASPR